MRNRWWWPLSALTNWAITSNSGEPSIRDLESMLKSFKHWHETYDEWAKEHRERHAKLALIGDKDADDERHRRDSDEENAAKCLVGQRALAWAIDQLRTKP